MAIPTKSIVSHWLVLLFVVKKEMDSPWTWLYVIIREILVAIPKAKHHDIPLLNIIVKYLKTEHSVGTSGSCDLCRKVTTSNSQRKKYWWPAHIWKMLTFINSCHVNWSLCLEGERWSWQLSLPHRVVKRTRGLLRKHVLCFSKHIIFGGGVPKN